MSDCFIAPDGKARCRWSGAAPEFLDYHDHEWGFPVDDDQRLFEKLCLESFQSGLSWRTILVKRDNFRTAFHNFDFEKIAPRSLAEYLCRGSVCRASPACRVCCLGRGTQGTIMRLLCFFDDRRFCPLRGVRKAEVVLCGHPGLCLVAPFKDDPGDFTARPSLDRLLARKPVWPAGPAGEAED